MNLLDLDPAKAESVLSEWLRERGEPAYRVRQLAPRLWRQPVPCWDDASELPRTLRGDLTEAFPLCRPTLTAEQRSTDGTRKLLWRFTDGTTVESVVIPEGRRITLCISSQAGCAYRCVFCATGAMGFGRHLAPWEIAAQVRELVLDRDRPNPTNVVFMGMGEPLHNWTAVDRALTILNHPLGLGIGARRITVSTIGIVPALAKLALRPEQFRVALSLHSPFGARRASIMPVERKHPLSHVLDALQAFPRRVTFEYVMIQGVNDGDDDVQELARIARSTGALVNLLPLHPGGVHTLEPTRPNRIEAFADTLRSLGVSVTVRRSRGLDISAACGQLRVEVAERSRVAPEDHAGVEQ